MTAGGLLLLLCGYQVWWSNVDARAVEEQRRVSIDAAFASPATAAPGSVATDAAPLPWPLVVERALASDDEHAIKLVYSCREHERVYGGDLGLRAAARAVADA